MAGQITFEESFGDSNFGDAVSAIGEPHLACVLLLDVSGSMHGEPIENLCDAIDRFKTQVCKDEIARKRVDVAIVSFSDNAQVVSDFVPIEQLQSVRLTAYGMTNMAEGIDVAIDLVKNRNRFYQQLGVPFFKPWIFMITDGMSTSFGADMKRVEERIAKEESAGSNGKLSFWALGLGQYDSNQMFRLTKRVIELRQHDFTGIFDWLSDSMTSISQSSVGDTVPLRNLPDDVRKAEKDRAIGDDWY